MRYAFFIGCLIPSREPNYETSIKMISSRLGIELIEMSEVNCCAPFGIQSLDYMGWLALAARNICIAEEMNLDLMTICNECYESFLMVNTILKEDSEIRKRINEILFDVGKEFKGTINVKHFVDVLYDDIGIKKIADAIERPLKGLRVAVQPGCHLMKPKRLHLGERIGGINKLDNLVEATGVKSIQYNLREMCCGGPLRGVNDEVAQKVLRNKLINIKNANVDCIVTVCPFCYIELDAGQLEMKRLFKEEYEIPVLNVAELLRLAMGMSFESWELRYHKIPLTRILGLR